jgi:hypothetical protein
MQTMIFTKTGSGQQTRTATTPSIYAPSIYAPGGWITLMRCKKRRGLAKTGAKNASLFLSAFPVFVPSLSWLSDRF